MLSTGVLASMCTAGLLVCLAAVHGAAGNRLLQTPPNASQLAHCPTCCGDVKISYPFGIGPGCFRQGFELTCRDRPPKLFLGNSTIQMTYISAGSSTAGASTLGYNITMSPGTDTYNMAWKPPAEGVMINLGNNLYVVGCDVGVYMSGDNITDPIGYCMSICTDNRETMERANVGGYCGGIGCCFISLSTRLRLQPASAFMINLVRHNSTRAEQDKALSKVKIFLSYGYYQFLFGSDLFSSWVNTSNAYLDATSVFDFAITDQPNCERAQLNNSYACNNESNCYDLPFARGYSCFCSNSQGNPYVVDGCTQGLYLILIILLFLFFFFIYMIQHIHF